MTTDSAVPQNPQAPPPPLGGLSPADLLRQGAAADTMMGESHPFEPPGLEELAEIFPQFEVLELIGKGGMGAVYRVRQKALDRIVALKILPPAIGGEASFADRFEREAKALAKLNHPGIVTLHEFGRAGDLYFILMEYVDGVNLRQLLNGGRISPREALAIVPQICDALQFAHDRGIVHRDIKPENLLIDRLGRVKVADFGLAKLAGGEPEVADPGRTGAASLLTETGKVMGTPRYMAPEQIERPAEVDHRADIYALGVVLYQMLTGELPGERLEAPSKKVRIDVRLDEIVLQALERKPELRFQQVSVMKTRVEETLGGDAGPPPKKRSKRATAGLLLQLAALMLMLAGLRDVWTKEPEGYQIATLLETSEASIPIMKEIVRSHEPDARLIATDDPNIWWLSVVRIDQQRVWEITQQIHGELQRRLGKALEIRETRSISASVLGKLGLIHALPLRSCAWVGLFGAALLVFSPIARVAGSRAWAGPLALKISLGALLVTGLLWVFFPQDRFVTGFGSLAVLASVALGMVGWASWQGRAVALGGWAFVFLWILTLPFDWFEFPMKLETSQRRSRSPMNSAIVEPTVSRVVLAADLPKENRLQFRKVDRDEPAAEYMKLVRLDRDGREVSKDEFFVSRQVIVWDEHVELATLSSHSGGREVKLTLDDTGAARLAAATKNAHGTMRLAVIVDGVVKTAPVVQSQLGRQVQISGLKESEAIDLIRSLPGWEELLKTSLPWQWLEQIDAGNYQKSHAVLSGFTRSTTPEAQWTATVSAARLPLGEVVSRVFKQAEDVKSVPGMPDGEYVAWHFETHFAHKQEAVETVLLTKEGDAWKPAGYFIRWTGIPE